MWFVLRLDLVFPTDMVVVVVIVVTAVVVPRWVEVVAAVVAAIAVAAAGTGLLFDSTPWQRSGRSLLLHALHLAELCATVLKPHLWVEEKMNTR